MKLFYMIWLYKSTSPSFQFIFIQISQTYKSIEKYLAMVNNHMWYERIKGDNTARS